MKKAKEFIVGSTIALFLSSSTLAGSAAYQAEQYGSGIAAQIQKENRYQKKMHYKQLLREKQERRMNS